jgi:hypothetical protein
VPGFTLTLPLLLPLNTRNRFLASYHMRGVVPAMSSDDAAGCSKCLSRNPLFFLSLYHSFNSSHLYLLMINYYWTSNNHQTSHLHTIKISFCWPVRVSICTYLIIIIISSCCLLLLLHFLVIPNIVLQLCNRIRRVVF